MSGSVYTQNSLLEQKIDITIVNVPIEKALIQIEKISGHRFSYNSDIFQEDLRVSIVAKDKPLGKLLLSMLGKEYYFKSSGKYIIILRKIQKTEGVSMEKSCKISGRVIDFRSGKPLATVTLHDMASMDSCLIPHVKPLTMLNSVSLKAIPAVDSTNLRIIKRIVSKDILINSNNVTLSDKRFAQFSLVPRFGTNQLLGGSVVNRFSINLLGGYSNGVSGIEVGGIVNMNKENVHGFQCSGLVNMTGKDVIGFQASGAINYTVGNVKGMQLSGIGNIGADTIRGIQVAGLYNECKASLNGVQVSPGLNFSRGRDKVIQIAGLMNYAPHPAFQFGVINVADSSDGFPMGVINIVKHGYYAFSLTFDDIKAENLLFSMGTHKLYSIVGLTNQSTEKYKSWGICYGFGTHILYPHRLSLTIEMISSVINAFGRFDSTTISRFGLSGLVSLRIRNNIYISLGPTLNTFIADADNLQVSRYISEAITGKSWHYSSSLARFDVWLGASLGIKIKI